MKLNMLKNNRKNIGNLMSNLKVAMNWMRSLVHLENRGIRIVIYLRRYLRVPMPTYTGWSLI